MEFEIGKTIYENPLSCSEDIEDFVIESSKEGQPVITFPNERMRMESEVHFLLWCPKDFPDNIVVSWEFKPLTDAGLAMFWCAAKGIDDKDLFDPSLDSREGQYGDYKGEINAIHNAYYRRNTAFEGQEWGEINFHLCSLRKSTPDNNGPVMQRRPDPFPSARDAIKPYQIQAIKYGPHFRFLINDYVVIDWKDKGENGPIFTGGKIGFRQMKDLIADYSDLRVNKVSKKDK